MSGMLYFLLGYKNTFKKGFILADTSSIKQLLEAGAHFGHQASGWHPRMKKYIFTKRNGIHIIDLEQTVKFLAKTQEFVKQIVADGGTILFVGTKKQAQESVETEAKRCGMYYVNQRWLGGTLTNFALSNPGSITWSVWKTRSPRVNSVACPRKKPPSWMRK